ncbi:MAG: hypothetical protein HYY18_09205 [Planctomycetes bacterium]|nr:hypothetical protein [Planctomycetota bacterium]
MPEIGKSSPASRPRAAAAAAASGADPGRAALALAPDDPDSLNTLAWTLVTAPGAKPEHGATAARWAARSVELIRTRGPGRNTLAGVLDTLAAAYLLAGDAAKAVEAQREAVELAEPGLKAELEVNLRKYEEALQRK